MNPEIQRMVLVGMVVVFVIVVVLVSTWGSVHLVAKTFEVALAVARMVLLKK